VSWLSELFLSQWQKDTTKALQTIMTVLSNQLQEIKKMTELTDKFQAELEELVANVEENGSKIQSGIIAIQALTTKQAELIQQLKDAQAENNPAAIQLALESLEAQNDALVANTGALAAAIPANT
jgi:predicted AAA+ superfamily ATPase